MKKERKRRDRQDNSMEDRESSIIRGGGLGMKLDQKNILAGHSRKMRDAKDLAKQLVAR